jgi:hypothetical protein
LCAGPDPGSCPWGIFHVEQVLQLAEEDFFMAFIEKFLLDH